MSYTTAYPAQPQWQPYDHAYGAQPQACRQYSHLLPPPTRHQYTPSDTRPQSKPLSDPFADAYSSPRQDMQGVEDDGIPKGSIYAQNKARFDNPFAHNDDWAPTLEDQQLRQLPKIDFSLRVKARLSRSAGKPFDPEPRSFQRPPRVSAAQPFRPIVLESDGKTGLIGAGFRPNYFGPLMTAHDVSAADYARFLEDIFTAGKVSGAGQVVANVAPITMHMGITGYFVTKAIVKGMARRNEPLVIETIETWQERFFGPRGLDVYAVSKGERATAKHRGLNPEPLTPDVAAMTNSSSGGRHKKDRKHDKDAKPFLVIAPLSAGPYGGAYGRY